MPVVFQVSDISDSRLDDFSRLTDVALRKVREPEEGLYIAESRKVIERAIAAGHTPRAVLCPTEWLDSVLTIVADFPQCPVFVGESAVLEEITGFHIHRGALASMHRPEPLDAATLLAQASTIVVLEDIVDHTNVGAVFRSVAGLGADAVLVGRPCVYGLAHAGAQGVAHVLRLLRDEFEMALALSGCANPQAITRQHLFGRTP